MERLLVTIREAAEALGLSERSVAWLLATGKLPRRKLGKRVLIPRESVERLAVRGIPGRIRPISPSEAR